MNPPQNLSLKDTTKIICETCQNETFREVVFMRKASRILTGAPKDTYIPIPVFECAACGHVNDEFIISELKAEKPVDILVK